MALQNAGATMVVLEAIPGRSGRRSHRTRSSMITIGIGAGKDTSGQVLVLHDAFDIPPGKKAKFVRNFMAGARRQHRTMPPARAVAAVKDGSYPGT